MVEWQYLYRWRDGQMEGQIDGGMDRRDRQMEGWINGGMDKWRDRQMEGWIDGGMDESKILANGLQSAVLKNNYFMSRLM